MAGRRSDWAAEFAATAALALPLVLTNLAQTGLATVDTMVLGRLSPEALAAGALGTNLYFVFAFIGIGLVSATASLAAEARGRGRHAVRGVRRAVRQGLWSAGLAALPGSVALWHGEALLLALDQQPALAAEAGRYLRALMGALLPTLAFTALRSFTAALGRPNPALAISLAMVPANLGLALWLVRGGFGVPPLGLVGAGIATTAVASGGLLALALVVARHRPFRRYAVLGRVWRFDGPELWRFWRLGVPMAATLACEVLFFNAAAFVMGSFGTVALGAHAIALQVAATAFMVPLGIGQAATVRVGLAFGAGDRDGIRRAGRAALALGIGVAASVALAMLLMPATLVGLFLGAEDVDGPIAVAARGFLLFAALFHLADAAQAVAAGMLRGLQDARAPFLIAAAGYWLVGAPLGVALAFAAGLAGTGVWAAFAVALLLVAVANLIRWRRLTGRPIPPVGRRAAT